MPDPNGKKAKRVFIVPAVIVLLVCAAALALRSYYYNSISMPASAGTSPSAVEVVIPKGTSTDGIADILSQKGLIKNKTIFKIYIAASGTAGRLKAGKYSISGGMNLKQIIDRLAGGDIVRDTVKVTIPEGYTLNDIASAVEKSGLVSKDEFIRAALQGKYDYSFISEIPQRDRKLEGYLFPDTYEFAKGVTAEKIVDRMLSRFDQVFDGDMKKKAKEDNLTVDQVLTVASIIEKEAKLESERPEIAAVIYNRLKINKKLEMDSTVNYILSISGKKIQFSTGIDSPYNTYKYPGLPVGPIANPGKSSIEAALNPSNVDYLYFYAIDGLSGQHVFSRTFAEHQKVIEKYK